MKYPRYTKELAALLQRDEVLTVEDFMGVFEQMPMPSVYARIRSLVLEGKLSVVGKGRYLAVPKPKYHVEISDWMRECNAVMVSELNGVNTCLVERKGNLEVEVSKADMPQTVEVLRKHFERVIYRKDVKWLVEAPKGYILVGCLTTEAPLAVEEEVTVPAPEKRIVDALCRKEMDQFAFQRMAEVYPINADRLRRYAARRGVGEELSNCLEKLDQSRIEMFSQIQHYLSQTPIVRAWIFGSFSRGEETDASDVDILITIPPDSHMGLAYFKMFDDLENILKRPVDLVVEGSLRPFAVESVERDKYLIYERAS